MDPGGFGPFGPTFSVRFHQSMPHGGLLVPGATQPPEPAKAEPGDHFQ